MEEVLNLCEPKFFVEDQTLFIVHFLNNFTDKNTIKKHSLWHIIYIGVNSVNL